MIRNKATHLPIAEHDYVSKHYYTKVSSLKYVRMRYLDQEEMYRMRIASVKHCDHNRTICVDCVLLWLEEHTIYWDRTSGGRLLETTYRRI